MRMRVATVLAALAASNALGIQMASQIWATNRIQTAVSGIYSNVYTRTQADERIVELAPRPGNYLEVSNNAMTAIQSLQPAMDYADRQISTGNTAFVEAVINCPVALPPDSGQALGEFGTYGTLGALLAALAAAVAYLKRNKANVTDVATEVESVRSDMSYSIMDRSPASGVVALMDRAVNLVEPEVTAGTPAWTWSDGLAHGTPAYLYNDVYGEYMWGFVDENGDYSNYDALGNYLEWNGTGDADSEEVSFSYYDESEGDIVTVTATLETPYTSDVTALALPAAVSGKVRDFMVRLVVPENMPAFAWPSGVAYETEDGQMPDVSEPGVYLLAFTETGSGRFALLCRKVQGVE